MAKAKNKLSPLLFKDFKIEQIAFELRYLCEFHFLEKLTEFWGEIQNKLPDQIKFVEQKDTWILTYKNSFEIKIAQDRFAISQFYPESLIKEFIDVSKVFFDVAIKVLKITEIKRVGLRVFYTKDFEDAISVAEALYQTKYINYPDDLYLVNDGIPLIPTYSIGWQNKVRGMTYRLNGKSEILGVDLPIRLKAINEFSKPIEKTFNQVILDIDTYQLSILLGEFFPVEWINQAYNTVKGEGLKFFGDK